MRLWGCVHRLDFLRNVLSEGLQEERRIGINPYKLGFIGSTDTHNGTPGHVSTENFMGHVGVVDATPEGRLGEGTVTHDTLENNPGGLAAVWATENSRDAVFDALRRKETYATSGPRISLRFFGAQELPTELCADESRIAVAREKGVPMGGTLSSGATFFVEATADATPLSHVEIIKGWIDADGKSHQDVISLSAPADASVDPSTCARGGWVREDLYGLDGPSPVENAFYYARVLEVPTCRWSQRECIAFSEAERPSGCVESHIEQTVQQRAWSSPIWIGQ